MKPESKHSDAVYFRELFPKINPDCFRFDRSCFNKANEIIAPQKYIISLEIHHVLGKTFSVGVGRIAQRLTKNVLVQKTSSFFKLPSDEPFARR